MRNFFKDKEYKRIIPLFFLAAFIIIFYKFITDFDVFLNILKSILSAMSPFIAGFIIAYFLNLPRTPLEKLLKKSKSKKIMEKSRSLSILIVYIVFIAVIVIILKILIPSIFRSINDLLQNFPVYYKDFLSFLDTLKEKEILTPEIEKELGSYLSQFSLSKILKDVLSSLTTILGFSSYIFNAFLAFISSIYFLLEAKNFRVFIIRFLNVVTSDKIATNIIEFFGKVNNSFRKFLYCQLLDSLIIGTIGTIALFIIGSPYALLLGIILGVCNVIPYFGSIFASVGVAVFMLFTQGFQSAIITGIVLLTLQQIDGNILQPKLMGDSFALSPALVVIGISIGGSFWGISGMVMAIPIVSILKDLIYDFIEKRENQIPEEKLE